MWEEGVTGDAWVSGTAAGSGETGVKVKAALGVTGATGVGKAAGSTRKIEAHRGRSPRSAVGWSKKSEKKRGEKAEGRKSGPN